jgi:hypothetical protein
MNLIPSINNSLTNKVSKVNRSLSSFLSEREILMQKIYDFHIVHSIELQTHYQREQHSSDARIKSITIDFIHE